MKAKRLLVLAVGVLLVMNVSAREAKRGCAFRGKSVRSEQLMVRCDRCGKMIDLRKEAQFRDFERQKALKREAIRKEDFRKSEFRKDECRHHHRHHGRR